MLRRATISTASLYTSKKILQHWKIVVISAVVLAVLGFAVAKLTYTPSYSSKITFIANNKSSALAVSGQTQSDLNASATLAESFKYVFTTTELSKRVADNSGFKDISVSDIKSWVSVEAVEDTAIINLTVTTPNADVSYGIANAYVNNYESAINAAFPSTTLTVIDPPLLASAPNRDASARNYTIVGFAAGLVISIFAIVLAVIAKDTVKTADDVKDKLGVDVIGMVAHVNRKKKKKGEDYKPLLISDRRSGFPFIETFKIIRTKIEHTAQREKYKTFVVTSTAENEGKTTSAVNIALALAQNGKSVLLVDGDLRKPAVAKLLGINASEDGGVYGVINGEKTLAEAIKYSEKYNLFLLVSGKPVFDPSELLSTDAMSDIIKSAEKEFDYIILIRLPAELWLMRRYFQAMPTEYFLLSETIWLLQDVLSAPLKTSKIPAPSSSDVSTMIQRAVCRNALCRPTTKSTATVTDMVTATAAIKNK